MKTTVIEVAGLISALSAHGVEKQLARLPGVRKAEVNYVAGSATVTYDETRIDLKEIKAKVGHCGYYCSGELVPKHVCEAEDPPAASAAMAMPAHKHHADKDTAKVDTGKAAAMDHAAHEMGHGGGMSMEAMVRDMRNRFWIALIFSVPIFVYSPMGGLFTPPAPPFGLGLDIWLFFLASAAVLYPSWPFLLPLGGHSKMACSTWPCWWSCPWGPDTSSASAQPFSFPASSSMKRWRCFWCSSSSVIGWKCAPVPGRPMPFVR